MFQAHNPYCCECAACRKSVNDEFCKIVAANWTHDEFADLTKRSYGARVQQQDDGA